jgi:hypothetical protein
MKKGSIILFSTVLLLIFATGNPLYAQDRVAQLSAAEGDVTIKRAADDSVVEVRQIGPRVRNGSVFGKDEVRTGADSSATVLFGDGSHVYLKADTALTIEEQDLSALLESGKAKRPFGRTIRVLAGDAWANIAPNEEVATKFETPNGVAAVKGTRIHIRVDEPENAGSGGSGDPMAGELDWSVLIETLEGSLHFRNDSMELDIEDGYGIVVVLTGPGKFSIMALGTNPGILNILLPDGRTLSMNPGSSLNVVQTGVGTFNVTGARGLSFLTSKWGTVALGGTTISIGTLPVALTDTTGIRLSP